MSLPGPQTEPMFVSTNSLHLVRYAEIVYPHDARDSNQSKQQTDYRASQGNGTLLWDNQRDSRRSD